METEENGAPRCHPHAFHESTLLLSPLRGSLPPSLFLNFLFLCTFSFFHLKPRSSCQPNFAISSTIGSAFYVVPSWTSSPQHFPLSSQPFISSLAFNTMAEMICMFFLLLLHGVSISAPKIFFSCESMKTHFKLS